jgi:hypothetical protein
MLFSMRHNHAVLAAALAASAIAAMSPARAATEDDAPVHRLSADYEVYVGGLNALKLGLEARMEAAHYDMGLRMATKGFTGLLFDWRMTAESQGLVKDGKVQPTLARGDSVQRGKPRSQQLVFEPDGTVYSEAEPSVESENREPIPAKLREGSRDLTAAMFSALLAVGREGRCDHRERVFDARRLYELKLEHAGTDTLAKTSYSPYSGPAIVCRLRIHMLGGKRSVDERSGEERRMTTGSGQFATVWLARPFDGGMLLPVRLQYDMSFGAVTIYLAKATLTADGTPAGSLAALP